MGAMTLLVDRRGAEVSVSNNTKAICVRYPDGEVHRVGAFALARIIIHGDAQLSAAVLRVCEEAQVSMVILPGRSKSITVNVFPNVESHFKLRFAQYRTFFDDKLRLSLAQKVVAAKIEAQSKWLNHHNLCHDFSSALDEVQKAPNNASLMGIEGSVSKKYLELWRSLWDKSWNFHGRNRRPPLDPVNALLSLSYTIAGNAVGRLLSLYGLDMNLGFLHMPQRSRPSLALDALESIRPWIDQWLWLKVQEGILTPKHFYNTNDHGCRLNKDGRAIFFPMWYDDAETWLELPRRDSLALILKTLRKYRYRTEE